MLYLCELGLIEIGKILIMRWFHGLIHGSTNQYERKTKTKQAVKIRKKSVQNTDSTVHCLVMWGATSVTGWKSWNVKCEKNHEMWIKSWNVKKKWNVKCEYRPIWKCGSFDFLWRLALSQMIGFNGIWPNIKWSITQNHYQTELATEKALILIKMILLKIIWRRFKLVSAIASDELTMEPCCALKYYPAVDACQSEKVFFFTLSRNIFIIILFVIIRILFFIIINPDRMVTQKPSGELSSKQRRRTLARPCVGRWTLF